MIPFELIAVIIGFIGFHITYIVLGMLEGYIQKIRYKREREKYSPKLMKLISKIKKLEDTIDNRRRIKNLHNNLM